MSYVILFEAIPNPGREEDYLALATPLNELLPQQPGFLGIDRARSIMTEGKLLSISHWESEAAIDAWFAHPRHREAQTRGKQGIFKSMRITRLQVLSSRDVTTEG
ncbi:MAG: antibiotic biosynthesis monooxygenase [SAR324 cluster bacterium]|nr:antibiotic biosynthesis monooxygenase [SAR324 cluster bacterium]